MSQTNKKWSPERLRLFVESEVEGTFTEYKRIEKLSKTDKAKTDICKEVSAFANSGGGTLIFGVNDEDKKKTRFFDNGINAKEWKTENGNEPELWLRQILKSYIQRTIPDIHIELVVHPEQENREIIVVGVPSSHQAPHQLRMPDGKRAFYKRVGSECVEMEEYEIRDVMNRQQTPELEASPSLNKPYLANLYSYSLSFLIKNLSITPAEYFNFSLWIQKPLVFREAKFISREEDTFLLNGVLVEADKYIFSHKLIIPLFGVTPLTIPLFDKHGYWRLEKLQNEPQEKFYIQWMIEAPKMVPRFGIAEFFIEASCMTNFKTVRTWLLGEEYELPLVPIG